MNQIFSFSLCVLAIATTLEANPAYSTKYDNVNVDEILKNDRLFSGYFNCIMEKPDAKCTPDAQELKKILPDAIKTECSECSEKQKEGAKKVIKYLHDNKPDLWNELLGKFDPDGSLREKYKDQANSFFGMK